MLEKLKYSSLYRCYQQCNFQRIFQNHLHQISPIPHHHRCFQKVDKIKLIQAETSSRLRNLENKYPQGSLCLNLQKCVKVIPEHIQKTRETH